MTNQEWPRLEVPVRFSGRPYGLEPWQMADDLEIIDGEAIGAWIEGELTGAAGSVTGSVPDRYDAYVRILHPASLHGQSVTWGRIADELGRTVHPLAQWDAIVGASRYRNESPDWPGGAPETGSLERPLLAPLLEMLAEHTDTPDRALFGIWPGMTWGRVVAAPASSDGGLSSAPSWRSTDDLSFAFPQEQVAKPRLRASREYVVLAGSLHAGTFVEGWLSPSSPNVIWPKDRAWFLAGGIDFDSTLVGGSDQLAERIIENERFEAFPVGPTDVLTWDADKINPPLPDDEE